MRTSIEISDALLARARRDMARRKVTLRALVEEGLRRVLDEREAPAPFQLREAHFRGELGFAPGAGPATALEALRDIQEPRFTR